ncbi:MAG: hypothetical protein AAB899_02100, partial [Patescibacteria group bacterium]
YIAIRNNTVISGTKYLSVISNDLPRQTIKAMVVRKESRRIYFAHSVQPRAARITGIVVPHINAGARHFERVPQKEATWYLYQKVSRSISGEAILFNGSIPSPNLDDQILAAKRLYSVRRLLRHPMYYASGSIRTISAFSRRLLEK